MSHAGLHHQINPTKVAIDITIITTFSLRSDVKEFPCYIKNRTEQILDSVEGPKQFTDPVCE